MKRKYMVTVDKIDSLIFLAFVVLLAMIFFEVVGIITVIKWIFS